MTSMITRSIGVLFSGSLMLLALIVAPTTAQDEKGKYMDDEYDFSITVSAPWKKTDMQGYSVPGIPRAVFSQGDKASIVLFVQKPGSAFDPRFLVDESAKSMKKSLGTTIDKKEVRTVAGKKAMWLIVKGKGTGGALDGKGAVQTSQHWVAIPREKDIVVALLTSPESEFAANQNTFEKALKSLKVGGKQTKTQLQSK